MRLGANQILAIVLAVFAVGYLIMAFQIRVFPLPRPIDSDMFPKVLGLLLLGLSVILFLEKPKEVDEAEHPDATELAAEARSFLRQPWMEVAVTAAAVALYALLLRPLGFLVVSVALVAGLSWYYGYRNHLMNLAVAVVAPLVLYMVLTRGLGIHLPRGIIPF
jgi:putative tricarboxylic transport membrane protein